MNYGAMCVWKNGNVHNTSLYIDHDVISTFHVMDSNEMSSVQFYVTLIECCKVCASITLKNENCNMCNTTITMSDTFFCKRHLETETECKQNSKFWNERLVSGI